MFFCCFFVLLKFISIFAATYRYYLSLYVLIVHFFAYHPSFPLGVTWSCQTDNLFIINL